ncbi:MAG: ATP-binding protein [Candidatus Micrarchaeia archaeon]
MPQERYVLTGGPATGKTTLLGELKKHDFSTVPEAARTVLEQKRPRQMKIALQHQIELARKVQQAQKENLQKNAQPAVVFDRSPVDPVAYVEAHGEKPTKEILRQAKDFKCDIVFLLEPLKNYRMDAVRREDKSKAQKLHKHIRQAYARLGHNVIEVPDLGSVQKRAEFVKRKIEEFRRTKAA